MVSAVEGDDERAELAEFGEPAGDAGEGGGPEIAIRDAGALDGPVDGGPSGSGERMGLRVAGVAAVDVLGAVLAPAHQRRRPRGCARLPGLVALDDALAGGAPGCGPEVEVG